MNNKYITVTVSECRSNPGKDRRSIVECPMFLRLDDITSLTVLPVTGDCLISTKTYGPNGLVVNNSIEEILAQMIMAGGTDMFIDGGDRGVSRAAIHRKIEELNLLKKHSQCIRCGGRVGLITGYWDYIPDDEPYENGVVEEALFEEGVAALSGHKCERCGHIQNINIEG